MAKLKIHNAEQIESIEVILSQKKTPIAYAAKKKELMEDCGMTEEEAEKMIDTTVFEMEMYYSPGLGLFMVEADALEGGANIVDPYTGEEMEESDED